MNELILRRTNHHPGATLGELEWNGEVFAVTLEDPVRSQKVAGETAIPAGTYPLRWRKVGRWAPRWTPKTGH